jgi:hypothetical protein
MMVVERLRRVLTLGPDLDGRVVVLGTIAVYLSAVAAARSLWGIDLWPFLGVPSGPSLFFDARNLTAAWECQRLGYDPLYENPCDPWDRPLMYLRPWLTLGALGLDQSDTFAVAAVLITAMFGSFVALVGRVPGGTGLTLALAACSPAVMLSVERGNMDVALFSLVAIAMLLWRTWPGVARVASPILVLFGAVAKIYPFFALPAFLAARSRIAAHTALVCTALFGMYIAWNLSDVAHVAEIAIQGQLFSYGARILPAHLYHQVGADHWPGPAAVKQLVAAVPIGFITAAVAIYAHRRLSPPADDTTIATASMMALHAGALIYLGTFAVANNFDYRLVFLMLTLPQLAAWACVPTHRLSALAGVTLVAILVLLWVGSLSEWLDLWDELASWAVGGLLVAVLAATIPRPAHVFDTLRGGRRRLFRPDGR